MCVSIFSTNLSETSLILSRTERDVIKNVYWSASCEVPVFLLEFNETYIFVGQIFVKVIKYQI
jgi:hypothetical protein